MPLPKIATPTYELVLPSSNKKIKYMGASGSGQLTKIINQICIAGLVQG